MEQYWLGSPNKVDTKCVLIALQQEKNTYGSV